MTPFWVAGVVVLCLLAAHLVLGLIVGFQGKTYDQAIYAVTGLGASAIAICLPLAWGWLGWPVRWAPRLKRVLGLIAVLGASAFIAVTWKRWGVSAVLLTMLFALLQTVVVEGLNGSGESAIDTPVIAFFTSLLAWSVAVSLGLLESLNSRPAIAAFITVFIVISAALTVRPPRFTSMPQPGWIAHVIAMLVILVLSLRTEHLFEILGIGGAIHHWGAWVGTIDLMRQGGWLLWDTPAHYGFLNMIVVDAIPAPSWTAFYLASAAAYALVASGMYLIGRTVKPGWPGWLFGLGAGCVVAMFTAGPITQVLANLGAFRYLPGFLILMLLVVECRIDESGVSHRRVMIGGCVLWVIAVLWGPESIVYSSAAWLPAYVVMSVREVRRRGGNAWSGLVKWLALPVFLLLSAALAIQIIWSVNLGHGPDWLAAVDYAIGPSVTRTLVAQQVLVGSGMLILLGFSVIVTDTAIDGVRWGASTRSLAAWLGMLGLYWGVNIHTQQRSLEELQPLAYAVLVVAVVMAAKVGMPGNQGWPCLTRAAVAPMLILPAAAQLSALYANPGAPGESLAALAATARHGFTIEWMMPDADPELQQLLRDSGVTAETPLLYEADPLGNLMMPWTPTGATERIITNPQWTPNHPGTMVHYLPDDRYRLYLERFLMRDGRGGWLIQSRTGDNASQDYFDYAAGLKGKVFYDSVLASHVPTHVRQSQNWNLTWWEPADPAVIRPQFLTGFLQPLAADIVVDGEALSETAAPEIWAVFGPGWALSADGDAGGRAGRNGAQLWVYSASTRTVRFDVPVVSVPAKTSIRLNGIGVTAEDGPTSAEIVLDPGWTPITFTIVDTPAQPRQPKASDGAHEQAQASGKHAESPLDHPGGGNARGSSHEENRPSARAQATRPAKTPRGRSAAATPEDAQVRTPEPDRPMATPEAASPEAGPNRPSTEAREDRQTRSFVIGPISIATTP